MCMSVSVPSATVAGANGTLSTCVCGPCLYPVLPSATVAGANGTLSTCVCGPCLYPVLLLPEPTEPCQHVCVVRVCTVAWAKAHPINNRSYEEQVRSSGGNLVLCDLIASMVAVYPGEY